MSNNPDDIPLPDTQQNQLPIIPSPVLPYDIHRPLNQQFPNFFIPPPFPFLRGYPYAYPPPPPQLTQQNFLQNKSANKQFNFNEFNTKRNDLLNKIKEIIEKDDDLTNKLINSIAPKRTANEEFKKQTINITFYKQNTSRLAAILEELKNLRESIINDETNLELKAKIDKLKQEYEDIYSVLNDEKNLKLLNKQINKRKSKRRRLYRKKLKNKFDDILKEKAIEEKHAEIDKNLKIINDKIKQEKEKEETQKIVDEALHQVQKKLSDIKMMSDFCSSLRKLRLIRRQHARDKNNYPKNEDPHEEDFENSVKEIETVILNQKLIYENEKRNLLLKIDLEKEKRTKKANDLSKEKLEIELGKYEKILNDVLFGKCESKLEENERLNLSKQFHNQSESSLENLLFIRQQWDQYIVANETPGASGIPLEWIYPSEPSDSNWAKYLIKT